MTQTPRYEKTAHLVLRSFDPDKEEQRTHVQEYAQACQFVERQPPENDLTFDWHGLDERLPPRFSIHMARRAIHLRSGLLEIPRLVACAIELQLPSHEIMMGGFCLQASDIVDPSELYQRYTALRARLIAQDAAAFDARSHEACLLPLGPHSSTAAA